ncbi:MAG: hypothetical protein H0W08_17905 [Acidobacteria bacterium]|nr:hypothetical protein [Acidobacteriota bacterium]
MPTLALSPNPYRGFLLPAEVIEHSTGLYRGVSLSLRDVELILAARSVMAATVEPRSRSIIRE